ncbi:hypothetical protein [Streptomyces sp. NPDC048392]|uniref:hypothetical protein n=1 Tax=Streptomyces sp. NPDC048392 TaxID=3365543 RepID=UPI0037200D33
MRNRTIAAALAAAAALTLTACEGESSGPNTPDTVTEASSSPTKEETAPAETTETDTDTSDTAAGASDTGTLPDLVGQDLQAAQDAAQAAGFYALDDQDASGQGRLQILDRNWTVCSQEPVPGAYPTDTFVTLFAVKDGESC